MSGSSYETFSHYYVSDRGYKTPCWIWKGSVSGKGYALANRPGFKKGLYAYRLFYEKHKGNIPRGLELDHLCRVRDCVNPEHLEAVLHIVNIRRKVRV